MTSVALPMVCTVGAVVVMAVKKILMETYIGVLLLY